jgi:hypothetical protein
MKRREFIVGASSATFLLAGCITDGSGDDINIYNDTGETITATILVTNADTDEQVLEEIFTLQYNETDSNDQKTYSEVSNGETVKIHLSVNQGPQGVHKFIDTNADSSSVTIYIKSDRLRFIEGHA